MSRTLDGQQMGDLGPGTLLWAADGPALASLLCHTAVPGGFYQSPPGLLTVSAYKCCWSVCGLRVLPLCWVRLLVLTVLCGTLRLSEELAQTPCRALLWLSRFCDSIHCRELAGPMLPLEAQLKQYHVFI